MYVLILKDYLLGYKTNAIPGKMERAIRRPGPGLSRRRRLLQTMGGRHIVPTKLWSTVQANNDTTRLQNTASLGIS